MGWTTNSRLMVTKVKESRILTARQVELGYRVVMDDNFTYIYHEERLVAKVTRGVVPRAIREAVWHDSFWHHAKSLDK